MALTRPKASQINTVITNVSDPLIVLNNNSTTANIDVGLVLNRNGGNLPNVALFWDESANIFAASFTTSTGNTNANIEISEYANLKIHTIFGNIGGPNIHVSGNLVPTANVIYDLGTPSQRWGTGYFASSTLDLGGSTISVDSTGFKFTPAGGDPMYLYSNNTILGTISTNTQPNITSVGNLTSLTVVGNINSNGYNFANGISIIDTLGNTTTTANTNMKGYVDGEISTTTSAITTANTNLKGYVDGEISTTTSAITTANTNLKGYVDAANTIQSNQISGANLAITTANTNMKGYVDAANTNVKGYVDGTISNLINGSPATLDTLNEIATALGNDPNLSVTLTTYISNVQGNVSAANAAIITANTNMKGYTDNLVTTANTNLKGYVDGQLSSAEGNITSANTNMKGYVDGQISTTTSAITTANTNIKGYVDGEISTTTSAITTANTNLKGYVDGQINSTEGNITSANTNMKGYVDGQISTTTSAITTANTNMKGYVDNIDSTLTANAAGQAGAIADLYTIKANLSNPTFTGTVAGTTASFTGSGSFNELSVTQSSGDEGGQINLAQAVSNTTLAGDTVTVDVWQNRLRFFEQGGDARGAFIDLSACSPGVGTNLLSGGGGGTPGGADTQLQFNDSGVFNGALSLYYFKGNGVVLANAGVTSTNTTTGTMIVTGGVGVSGNINAGAIYTNTYNYSNGTSVITTITDTISTANTNMKGYVDGQISTTTSAITTANTNMKGYVDGEISTTTSAITTANTNLKGYVDGQISSTEGNITTANTNMKGYVDNINSTLTANAGSQAASINNLYDIKANVLNPVFTNNVSVQGNLLISGNLITTDVDNLQVDDSLIYFAKNNTTDFLDIGIVGSFTKNSLYQHGGIVRDATDGIWKFFNNVQPVPSTTIDFGSAEYSPIKAGNIFATGNVVVGANLRLSGALLNSSGSGGVSGQYLVSTGTGFGWLDPEVSTLTDGGDTTVSADGNFVNVVVNSSNILIISEDTVSAGGNVSATYFLGNGSQLVGLPAGYTNTDVANYLPTHSANVGATSVNATNLYGTIRTAAQTSITSVGTLTGLTVSGAPVPNANATVTLGSTSAWWSTAYIQNLNANTSVINTANVTANGLDIYAVNSATSGALSLHATSGLPNRQSKIKFYGTFYNTPADVGERYVTSIRSGFDSTQTAWSSEYLSIYVNSTTNDANSDTNQAEIARFTNYSGMIMYKDIRNGQSSGTGNIGASGASFNTVFAKATSAQYADLAEVYVGDKHYVPGTVVVFGGTQEVTVSTTSHDPSVAGVVSTNPAYLMNDTVDGVAVALQGRVPCRVLGPVSKGDRVVSSDVRGVAERLDMTKYQPGCIIGKALEAIPDNEIATIEVVVGRN